MQRSFGVLFFYFGCVFHFSESEKVMGQLLIDWNLREVVEVFKGKIALILSAFKLPEVVKLPY